MGGSRLDLRLLPAASACWGACLVGVRLPAPVPVAIGLAAVLGASLLVAVRPPRCHGSRVRSPGGAAVRERAAGRAGRPARTAVRGHAVLVLAAVGAVLVSVGAQGVVRDAGLLAELVADRATVRVLGTVSSEPVPLRSTAAWDGERVRLDLAIERVTGGGRSGAAATRVLVLAGGGWREVPFGARVHALGRLEPTDAGDGARAILVVRGPPTVREHPAARDAGVRHIRQALLRVSDHLPPDSRGLVPGAAIGDTSRVPPELDEAMRVAGLTHITAVSGAHFAIVGAVVLAVTAAAGVPRTARAGVVAVAMAAFVLLVHPSPSVLRAAVMGAIGVWGLVLGRPSRALPALAACVVVLLVADPWLAADLGFTLSVVATAGIVLASGPLAGVMAHVVPDRAARLIAVPLAAQCACGPVVAAIAPGLSTYAVPANLLAAPAVPPATVLGVLAALVAPWWEAGGVACAQAAGWAAWWIATVARGAAALPGARLPWPGAPWGPALLAVATLGSVLAVVRPWRREPPP